MELNSSGISVIICCYNSAKRITPTLKSLFNQSVSKEMRIELLVVDNNSKDNTIAIVNQLWKKNRSQLTPFSLSVISEPIQGLINARLRGLQQCQHEVVIFVDDDNELNSEYIKEAYKLMSNDLSIGICGGPSMLPEDFKKEALPNWWERYKSGFAVGDRGKDLKNVDYVWGAGLVLRRKAFEELQNLGFKFTLVGRDGDKLSSGEDQELCYAIRLLGYKIMYQPKLLLHHRIEMSRINKNHLKSLHKGFGSSHVYLGIYNNFIRRGYSNKHLETIKALASFILRVLISTLMRDSILHVSALSKLKTILAMTHEEYCIVTRQIRHLTKHSRKISDH